MNLATIIGLVGGFGALGIAFLMEGGDFASLAMPSPIIIILGGTFGALLIAFDLPDVMALPRLIGETFKMPHANLKEVATMFVNFAEKSRRDGLLSLEEEIAGLDAHTDPLLKKGMRYVIDGSDSEAIESLLGGDLAIWEKHKKHEIELFEAAGGFSPTMGVIGTVLGLIVVLSDLGNPEELGHKIAVAFIATLEGVGFANLFWLPIGAKLKLNLSKEKLVKEMIVEGILAIQKGENPKLVGDKLAAYLPEKERASLESFNQEGA